MRTKILAAIACWAACGAGWAAEQAPESEQPESEVLQIELAVGDQREISVPGAERVSLTAAASAVAELRPLDAERFLVVGRTPGMVKMLVLRAGKAALELRVEVRDETLARFRRECAALLGQPACCPGLQLAQAGGRVVLSGRVADLETYHQLGKLARAFPELVLLVEVEPAVLDGLLGAIHAELEKRGLKGIEVSRVGRRIFLTGSVADEQQRREAELIVDALVESVLGQKEPIGQWGPGP
ncbi:MAG: BON domain-containing protein [Deltaproteobacteria bacterium]|nr:BON domain-containing protein [Deltaproteobacteria bacterium]